MFRLNLFFSWENLMVYFLLCVLVLLFVCVPICVWKTFWYQSILSVLCLADKVFIFCLVCHVRVSLCSCNSRALQMSLSRQSNVILWSRIHFRKTEISILGLRKPRIIWFKYPQQSNHSLSFIREVQFSSLILKVVRRKR